jgi:hypothetical protein
VGNPLFCVVGGKLRYGRVGVDSKTQKVDSIFVKADSKAYFEGFASYADACLSHQNSLRFSVGGDNLSDSEIILSDWPHNLSNPTSATGQPLTKHHPKVPYKQKNCLHQEAVSHIISSFFFSSGCLMRNSGWHWRSRRLLRPS